jgi:hypothetical protein
MGIHTYDVYIPVFIMLTMTSRRALGVYRTRRSNSVAMWPKRLLKIVTTLLICRFSNAAAAAMALPSLNEDPRSPCYLQSPVGHPLHSSSSTAFYHNPNSRIALLSSSALLVAVLGTHPLAASATGTTTAIEAVEQVQQQQQQAWKLGNGEVELPDPLAIAGLQLRHPRLLGSGGGGAVFSMENAKSNKNNAPSSKSKVAVKVSWQHSAVSVENECRILQLLQDSSVSGVETCLGQAPYPTDPTRVMIALQPVFTQDDVIVNSVSEIIGLDQQSRAVKSIVKTMVEMLAVRTVTTDVQPLISQQTGDVLFIDLTEAKVLASDDISVVDLSLASSFVSEMLSRIPDTLQDIASKSLWQELQAVGDRLPVEFCEILRSQNGSFLLPETLEYLDAAVLQE